MSASHREYDSVMTTLTVNGETLVVELNVRPWLLEVLQHRMGLFGPRTDAITVQCGACTVHVDSRRVVSCLTLAVQAEGREMRTIEGVAADGILRQLQQAFVDNDAMQYLGANPLIPVLNEGVDERRVVGGDELLQLLVYPSRKKCG
jgi:xanthine dehydrogenase iron-sulfur cluster and FAD-binding subunit A